MLRLRGGGGNGERMSNRGRRDDGRIGGCRRACALLVGLLVLASWPITADPASQNGATPPRPGGLAGQFLVAAEEMGDPRFEKSVILMIHHDASGAMGLIVNRPIAEVPVSRVLEGIGLDGSGIQGKIRLHYGGPVEPRQGLTLHTSEYTIEGTLRVAAGIALTGNPEVLRAIGEGRGPKRYLVALGYAGWAPGQLEAEIKAGGWISVPADQAIVFDEQFDTKWERAKAKREITL
jgi:putative transcriptional regulator